MAHDVFLSYSNKDKAAADAVCHALEQNRIRVWMARAMFWRASAGRSRSSAARESLPATPSQTRSNAGD